MFEEYHSPNSLEEAVDMLAQWDGQAQLMAGGTDLLVSMKQNLITSRHLINIKRIKSLAFIDDSEGGLRIGALTRLSSIIQSSLVQEKFPVLAQAAGLISSPPLQNMGTIGGNLCLNTRCSYYNKSLLARKSRPLCFKVGGEICHVAKGSKRCYATYQGDTAPALIALGAKVTLVKKGNKRVIPLSGFYKDDGLEPFNLETGEVLTQVEIPAETESWSANYQKLRIRETIDYPLVGVVAALDMAGENCMNARLVLTAVSSAPVLVEEASDLLKGRKPDGEIIAKVADAAFKASRPMANTGSTPLYRKRMVRVLTKRAIANVLGGK